MRNIYNFDTELEELVVSQTESKSIEDIQRLIGKGKPMSVVDGAITLYLPTTDPAQVLADEWYHQHLLVQSLDPDEERLILVEEGEEDVTIPNAYDLALEARTGLENNHPWLLAYRGEKTSVERPEFVIDVDGFKSSNPELFTKYLKAQGKEIYGYQISLNKSNQNGLSALYEGASIAQEHSLNYFPVNFLADTSEGKVSIPFDKMDDLAMFYINFISERQEFF